MYSKKEFFRFALPSAVSMLVFSSYTIVDGIFVAHGVGDTALAAIDIAMPFVNFMFALAIMFAVGTSTLCAIRIGEGKKEEANAVFSQNIFVVVAMALIFTALVNIFADEIAVFLGSTPETNAYVTEYLRILSYFSVCFMTSYCFEVLVKTGGHPSVSMIGVGACALTNIVLDYVFIFIFDWGIMGAAVATGIAQTISLIIFASHFIRGRSNIRFKLTKPFLSIYKRIIPLGFSDFISEIALGVTIFIYNRALLKYVGTTGIIAYAVVMYINTLAMTLIHGVTQGMQPLVSISLGRHDSLACRAYRRLALISAASAAAAVISLCLLFPEGIASLVLGADGAAVGYTAESITKYVWAFLPATANVVLIGYFTATARPRVAFAFSAVRGIVFPFACVFTLAAIFGGEGIWFGALASEAACLAVMAVYLGIKAKRA